MPQPKCPKCSNEMRPSMSWDAHYEGDWIAEFPHDCVAYCTQCDVGLTRDGVLLMKVNIGGNLISAGIGRGGQIIFYAGPGDSEVNLEILCALEEKRRTIRKQADLSTADAQDTIWNAKRAKRRFRRWHASNRDPLVIPNERHRELVNEILDGVPDEEPDYLEIINDLTPNHVLVQRAVDYEISRRGEPALILAEFPDALRRLFDELIDAHRWGLDRAAVALCRVLLEEMAQRAVKRTGVHVLPEKPEHWLVAALGVLLRKKLLSHEQWLAADKIRRKGNDAVHKTSADVSAWEIIQITVDLLRSLVNQGLLSDWDIRN